MKDIETQMAALDDFVTRAQSQNAQHYDSHVQSLQKLSDSVNSSYSNIGEHFTSTYERVRGLDKEMSTKTIALQQTLEPLDSVLRQPLSELRGTIINTNIQEYQRTGETPQKIQYTYPIELPKTEAHEALLATLRQPSSSSDKSPSKNSMRSVPVVFNDGPDSSSALRDFSQSTRIRASSADLEQRPTTSGSAGLREMDVNVNVNAMAGLVPGEDAAPLTVNPSFKRSLSAAGGKLPVLKNGKKSVINIEGRENSVSSLLSQSTGRRRSPRIGS